MNSSDVHKVPVPNVLLGDEEIMRRTNTLISVLEHEIDHLGRKIDANSNVYSAKVLAAIRNGNQAVISDYIDTAGSNIDEICEGLIRGRPLTVYSLGSGYDAVNQYVDYLSPGHTAAFAADHMAGLAPTGNAKHVALSCGQLNSRGYGGPAIERGISLAHYRISSRLKSDPANLVEAMGSTIFGRLELSEGAIFRPYNQYLDLFEHISGHTAEYLGRIGLVLAVNEPVKGRNRLQLTQDAALASELLSFVSDNLVVMISADTYAGYVRRAQAITCAAGGLPIERQHNIFFDRDLITPGLLRYTLARMLYDNALVIQGKVGRYGQARSHDAYDYARENYGEVEYIPIVGQEINTCADGEEIVDILSEDVLCAKHALRMLWDPAWVYKPNRRVGGTVADIFCGSGTLMSQLIVPALKPGTTMFKVDVSPVAIDYQNNWKSGSLGEGFDAIGPKHEALMCRKSMGGLIYTDCDKLAREATIPVLQDVRVFLGHMSALPEEHKLSAIVEGFGSCSSKVEEAIIPTREKFTLLQRSKFDALASGGYVLSMHMVGSNEWEVKDAQTHKDQVLPSVCLSVEDIIKGYKDAGFVNIRCEFVPASGGLRAGFTGMVVIYAEKP